MSEIYPGNVVRANASRATDYRKLEVISHVTSFLERFYTYGAANYDRQITLAQDLCSNYVAGEIIKSLDKVKTRAYVLKGMNSYAYVDDVQVSRQSDGSYAALATFRQHLVQENKNQAMVSYAFKIRLENTARSSKNPNGFIINAIEIESKENIKIE